LDFISIGTSDIPIGQPPQTLILPFKTAVASSSPLSKELKIQPTDFVAVEFFAFSTPQKIRSPPICAENLQGISFKNSIARFLNVGVR
jgi:hypothetical protein